MKTYLITLCLFTYLSVATPAQSYKNPLVTQYSQPDSIKISTLFTQLSVAEIQGRKPLKAGIQVQVGVIGLYANGRHKSIRFNFPTDAQLVATGINVQQSKKGELVWKVDWQPNKIYQLRLVVALSDSATNKMLYSGYVFMPDEKKWKLMGSCLIDGQRNTLKNAATFSSVSKKTGAVAQFSELWLRQTNNRWTNLLNTPAPVPDITTKEGYLDQDEQHKREREQIEKIVAEGKIEQLTYKEGIFFAMLREGTGRQVNPTDSIVVFYKGYMFPDKPVFEEKLSKPITFQLNRLIMGYQIGLPLCRVGGKIKLVVPSRYAYKAHTLTPLFFPNSTLVFEVEVLDTKPNQ